MNLIMVFNFELLVLAITIVWLIILSVFFWQAKTHYQSLIKGASGKNLQQILDLLVKDVGKNRKDIDELKILCDRMEQQGQLHIQKIGLLRFNPFKDTGGDQSFVLALVDGSDTGVIISGIYSRLGTRWYAKKVKEGKGIEHELSDEEKQSLVLAKKSSI